MPTRRCWRCWGSTRTTFLLLLSTVSLEMPPRLLHISRKAVILALQVVLQHSYHDCVIVLFLSCDSLCMIVLENETCLLSISVTLPDQMSASFPPKYSLVILLIWEIYSSCNGYRDLFPLLSFNTIPANILPSHISLAFRVWWHICICEIGIPLGRKVVAQFWYRLTQGKCILSATSSIFITLQSLAFTCHICTNSGKLWIPKGKKGSCIFALREANMPIKEV